MSSQGHGCLANNGAAVTRNYAGIGLAMGVEGMDSLYRAFENL